MAHMDTNTLPPPPPSLTVTRSVGHILQYQTLPQKRNRFVGLVVKASASRAEDPGFEPRLRRDLSGLSHTSDLKIGTPVATPGVIG